MATIGAGGRKYKNLGDAGFDGLTPASKVVKITPDDNNDLEDGPCRGIWSGGSGTVNFIDFTGETVTDFPIFPGYNPVIATRVVEGGTASNIWAMY